MCWQVYPSPTPRHQCITRSVSRSISTLFSRSISTLFSRSSARARALALSTCVGGRVGVVLLFSTEVKVVRYHLLQVTMRHTG